jgi:hypothetical protein
MAGCWQQGFGWGDLEQEHAGLSGVVREQGWPPCLSCQTTSLRCVPSKHYTRLVVRVFGWAR